MESPYTRLMDALIEVLNSSPTELERAVVQGLEEVDPEIANEVKRRMFEFDDIAILDDRSIQKVLREVEMAQLALAMRLAAPDAFAAVTRNMAERAVTELRAMIGAADGVEIDAVIDAQEAVVEVIRQLEAAGEISVGAARE